MATELKPCPFCGGEAKTSFGTVDPDNTLYFGWVGCQKCQCFINYTNNNRGLKQATEAWNRRTEDEKPEINPGNEVKLVHFLQQASCELSRCEICPELRIAIDNACDLILYKLDHTKVVRCKDCKHTISDDALLYCDHLRGLAGVVSKDDFCSYGERRTGNGQKHNCSWTESSV